MTGKKKRVRNKLVRMGQSRRREMGLLRGRQGRVRGRRLRARRLRSSLRKLISSMSTSRRITSRVMFVIQTLLPRGRIRRRRRERSMSRRRSRRKRRWE